MVLDCVRKANNLKPILYLKLGIDGADVVSYRLLGQLEPIGNLLIVKTGGDQAENLFFPVGKRVEPLKAAGYFGNLGTCSVIHGVDQLGGDLR